MKTPRILLSGIAGNRRNYEVAIKKAGGRALSCYAPTDKIPADGLLLCGGGDIDPTLLGEENCGSRDIDLTRDLAEFALVRAFIAQKKPIFGICRGHQLINVALGGKLMQDMSAQLLPFHSPEPHGQTHDLYHSIATSEGGLLRRIFGSCCLVNSKHHQAIMRAGEGMQVCARSEGDVIEACEHAALPIFSVQFHPERLRAAALAPSVCEGASLFTHFIEQCRARM